MIRIKREPANFVDEYIAHRFVRVGNYKIQSIAFNVSRTVYKL